MTGKAKQGWNKGNFKHGLYLEIDLKQIDKRTRVGKTVDFLTDELKAYVGDNDSIVVDLLIMEIVYKAVRLRSYQFAKLLDDSHDEAKHYLPMSNSLRFDLQQLAKFAEKPKPPDLNQYLKEAYEKKADDNRGVKR